MIASAHYLEIATLTLFQLEEKKKIPNDRLTMIIVSLPDRIPFTVHLASRRGPYDSNSQSGHSKTFSQACLSLVSTQYDELASLMLLDMNTAAFLVLLSWDAFD